MGVVVTLWKLFVMSNAREWLDKRNKFYRRPLHESWQEDLQVTLERRPYSLRSVTAFAASRLSRQLQDVEFAKMSAFEPADRDDFVLYRLHMDWISSGEVIVTKFNDLKLIVRDDTFAIDRERWSFTDYLITSDKFPAAVWTKHPLHSTIGNVVRPRLTGVLGQFDCRYVNRARPKFKEYGIRTATKRQIEQYLTDEQFLPLGQIFKNAWFPKVLSGQAWRNEHESSYLYYALVEVTLCFCLLGVETECHKLVRKKIRRSLQNLRKKHGDEFADELLQLDAIKPSAV